MFGTGLTEMGPSAAGRVPEPSKQGLWIGRGVGLNLTDLRQGLSAVMGPSVFLTPPPPIFIRNRVAEPEKPDARGLV